MTEIITWLFISHIIVFLCGCLLTNIYIKYIEEYFVCSNTNIYFEITNNIKKIEILKNLNALKKLDLKYALI